MNNTFRICRSHIAESIEVPIEEQCPEGYSQVSTRTYSPEIQLQEEGQSSISFYTDSGTEAAVGFRISFGAKKAPFRSITTAILQNSVPPTSDETK